MIGRKNLGIKNKRKNVSAYLEIIIVSADNYLSVDLINLGCIIFRIHV